MVSSQQRADGGADMRSFVEQSQEDETLSDRPWAAGKADNDLHVNIVPFKSFLILMYMGVAPACIGEPTCLHLKLKVML